MILSFSELWEKAEQYCKDNLDSASSEILDELSLKIALYKAIIQRSEIKMDEKMQAKSQVFGEILLALCNLSFKEDVDVFKALGDSLLQRIKQHHE